METYKVTFYREDDKSVDAEGNVISEVIEFMAPNEIAAMKIFESSEPFAIIIKIEQI